MRKIIKALLLIFTFLLITSTYLVSIAKAEDPNSYTIFKTIDKNSFNEYRHLISKEFLNIKKNWEVNNKLDNSSLSRLQQFATKGFNYLPGNDLRNENLLNNVNIAISKALKYNTSDAAYIGLMKAFSDYLDKSSIKSITGEVIGLPKSGNAPFNVTLRANISDPTGTKIPKYNYVWWMDYGSKKVNIGTGPSINYTFKEEGKFIVFVDIKSAHKNTKGYTDVIPYRGKVEVEVKEKVASLIIKVNSDKLGYRERLKFTPAQAKYGLLFDATSSIPTGSAKFIRTEWNFGNGIKKSYSGEPKIERIKYLKEGNFDVKLKLKTNLGKVIEKDFIISIHDPIATIDVSPKEGFLGDKFTFRAKNTTSDDNLTYNWQIVDIINDEVVFSEQTKLFTYNFKNKGHFNVKLEVNGIDSSDRNIDTKNIYINSRAPVADFKYSIPELNKPNKVLLDATDSFDPDFSDTGKLKYSWEIDGARVNLDDANSNGSVGFYTFSNIGDHSVVLRVEDPDNIEGTKENKVNISSILSLDFSTNPRAIKRGDSINFEAISPEAQFFEWDFGDGNRSNGGVEEKIKHKYEKTGIFNVKLKVIDKTGKSNTYTRVVYVGDGENPVAILNIGNNKNNTVIEKNACKGSDAYIADRITSINFDAGSSIDIDGNNSNLDYSLKIGPNKYFTSRNTNYKFDELGCFPIILKVTSKKNKSSDTKKIWVKVKNIEPTLSKLVAKTDSLDTDPVIVTVDAIGALDKDGVITSYLWYYYTDLDEEPQDFRSTVGPSTKFVLPKITGNYYFVVLLTDDSDSRVSSKDIGKSTSLTLAGNNVNVPILELKTPDNSVHVGDEVIFNAKVQNILKQNISKKVQYFWDFDGDGFYDLETKTSSITHIYEKPGTFYVKLKVKHKGFSNTRNVEINVANSLTPNFDYVSVGNKLIFINKTTGSYENFSFNLGNGDKVENKDYFEYDYRDGKQSHKVELTVSDGTIVKKINKNVSKNMDNFLKSRKYKSGILVINPSEDKDNTITINKRISSISSVFFQNKKDFSEISADLDLEKDSDLNGGKDDDSDVISISDTYLDIELNKNKIQNIRIFVKDSDAKVILSRDYKIIKNYIKDEDINLDKVLFEGVTPEQKQKLDKLKNLVSSIVGDDGRRAKTYVSILKDEWGDKNERTKVIYEFNGFLESSLIQNKNEIIENLEELLLKENDDSSLKSIALRALQGLTPVDIKCDFDNNDYKSCKNYIDSSLEVIKYNDNVEQNRILGKSILEIIGNNNTLSTEEKLNYKSTLQNLIYGDVSNIPEENEGKNITNENKEDSGIISDILITVLYVILAIVGLFILGGLIYFLYYKLYNKNSNKDFKNFVEEKTSSKDDIFSEPTNDEVENKKLVDKSDVFSSNNESTLKDNKKEIKKDEVINKNKDTKGGIPEWLNGSSETIDIKNESKIEKSKVSDNLDKKEEVTKAEPKLEKVSKKEETKEIKNEDVDKITKVEDDIPDWLKGSLEETTKTKSEKPETKKEQIPKKEENKNLTNEDLNKITKVEDDIPDWLKGSLEETTKTKSEKLETKTKSETKKLETKTKPETKKLETKKEETKKEETKKEETKKPKTTVEQVPVKEEKFDKKITDKVENKKSVKTEEKQVSKKTTTPKKEDSKENATKSKKDSSDLWDDGMDVPDWLKS